MRVTRRDLLGACLAVLLAGGCVWLGFWQLRRLSERRARNAAVAARRALPPLEITAAVPLDTVLHRRVVARGVFDYSHERIRPGRSFQGAPGVALVTPLRLADGSAVLVDRGWVPSSDAFHVDPSPFREAEGHTVTVEGLAIPPPEGAGGVAILDQTNSSLPAGLPRRWPAPALTDGPHLSYAIQWFSFALIILVGTAALLRKSASATILAPF